MANSEASDRIEEAFIKAMQDDGVSEDGDILGDWLIIGHIDNPGDEAYGYRMLFSNGILPNHIVRGLLYTALHMINKGEFD